MFAERNAGLGIFFVRNHAPGAALTQAVENGDSVVLKLGAESVLVNKVENLGQGRFRGVVYGFESTFAQEFQGLVIDQEVEFEERHIVSCDSA